MTTITIERALLEQMLERFTDCGCEVCTRQSIEAIKAALDAPATAPTKRDPAEPPSNFAQRCKVATDCLPTAPYRAALERLHGEMLEAIAKAPAWHDAPNAPGLWISDDFEGVSTFNNDDLKLFKTSTGVRWYGPIPEGVA